MPWSRKGSAVSAADPAESRLIERVRGGDTQAFGELVRRYQRRAFAIAYRLLRHREDAEDLVQDSFMVALDRIDQFQPDRPFGPWFFRLVANRGLNAIETRRVRSGAELDPETPAADPNPEDDAVRASLSQAVAAAILDLSERQRLVVQLHELDGFSTAEVAGMLELAEPTVRWTLHAARKRLRQVLAGWKEHPNDRQ